jgi:hypothetical protein
MVSRPKEASSSTSPLFLQQIDVQQTSVSFNMEPRENITDHIGSLYVEAVRCGDNIPQFLSSLYDEAIRLIGRASDNHPRTNKRHQICYFILSKDEVTPHCRLCTLFLTVYADKNCEEPKRMLEECKRLCTEVKRRQPHFVAAVEKSEKCIEIAYKKLGISRGIAMPHYRQMPVADFGIRNIDDIGRTEC